MISAQDRRKTVVLIKEAMTKGASQASSCKVLGLSPRTYQRWTRNDGVKTDGRPQAKRKRSANKLSGEECERILEVCNRDEFSKLPPSQIVPILADRGEYIASESSFYRVLREASQMQHRGKARSPRKIAKPQGFCAAAVNQVWSWDITFLATTVRGIFYRLYMVMDVYSRKIVGWEIHENESAENAASLIQKASWAEGACQQDLVLHSDNGSPMKGATMLAKLQKLGIMPSFSRPSVSNDNPFSESLFGTLKYTPAYPGKPFNSIDEARSWVLKFVKWYNYDHRHSGLKFVTPVERHQGVDAAILNQRKVVYEEARRMHPERWSRTTRNWDPVGSVWLNPPDTKSDTDNGQLRKAA